MKPRVSILVATFRRPDGLEHLLRSLLDLAPDSPPHEIVVVDNDVRESADAVVSRFDGGRTTIRYDREPVRGIARARNRALDVSTGELCAFIDDDEIAEPRWLVELERALVDGNADGAFGPVVPAFAQDAPAWVRELGFHGAAAVPGARALAWHETYAGNALVRRDAFGAERFDEGLGLTGGEDVDLFARLLGRGARFVATERAVVRETVPAERTTLRWMSRRAYRNGITIATIERRHRRAVGSSRSVPRCAWKAITSAARAAAGWRRSKGAGGAEWLHACEHAGFVAGSLGARVREYA